MSDEEIPLSKQDQLAIAIARGKSIAVWARENQVPQSTAYAWARDPDLRRLVDEWRRHSLDQALGWIAGHSMRAAKGITNIGENAETESVKLKAYRAILLDQMAIAKQANLEYRVSQLEEKRRARTGTPNCQP